MATQLTHQSNLQESLGLAHLLLCLDPTLLPSLPTPSDTLPSPVLEPSQVPNLPQVSLRFCSPQPLSLGMQTARAWHNKQLLKAQMQWEQKNAQQHKEGLLPLTWHSALIADSAFAVMDPKTTAMDTIPHHQHQSQHHPHPYLSQHQPHWPTSWPDLCSTISKPQCWQLDLPMPSGTTMKILLKYHNQLKLEHCHPIHKGSPLPKGWVYTKDTEKGEAKEISNPSTYQLYHPLTTLT